MSVCFQSPKPSEALANYTLSEASIFRTFYPDSSQSPASLKDASSPWFFYNFRFMIADSSVQSYAQEKAFDKSRPAMLRGRVVKLETGAGLVSVRVSVVENPQLGFTLTRDDGTFDILVNGNEWITLHFLRNSYHSLKRRFYVRANRINLLEEPVEMELYSPIATPKPMHQIYTSANYFNKLDTTFGLQFTAEFYKLLSSAYKITNQQEKLLIDCLMLQYQQQQQATAPSQYVLAYEPLIYGHSDSGSASRPMLREFALVSSGSYETSIEFPATRTLHSNLKLHYNSASSSASASVLKPTVTVQLLNKHPQHQAKQLKLTKVHVQFYIEGQSIREQLEPIANLTYQFGWNRRNVYDQKVYGYSALKIRVGYEYEPDTNEPSSHSLISGCSILAPGDSDEAEVTEPMLESWAKIDHRVQVLRAAAAKRLVWFESLIHVEAHQMRQHSDVGRWTLDKFANRYDSDRETLYLSSGRSIPYRLAYPPTVSDPIDVLKSTDSSAQTNHADIRLMTRGPNNSILMVVRGQQQHRLVQLDGLGNDRRRLLDLPLSAIASRVRSAPFTIDADDDIQLLYNQIQSTLYVSWKSAGKIIQMSHASLLALNKTLSYPSGAYAPDDDVIIVELCGFGRLTLGSVSSDSAGHKLCRSLRLAGPHSLTLDEHRQVLYFIDGSSSLVALDLSSNLLTLLISARQAQKQSAPKPSRRSNEATGCRRSDLLLSSADYWPIKMSSLSWSRSDSSLYFIDQNTVFALRQDQSIELIAFGSRPARADFIQSLPVACLADKQRQSLGQIKSIALDDSNHELLLVHQWDRNMTGANPIKAAAQDDPRNSADVPKIVSRFYLAKARLGIRSGRLDEPNTVVDLHSKSVYNSNLLKLLRSPSDRLESRASINWIGQANLHLDSKQAITQTKPIPFLHLSSGFERIDSVEINTDGSIFVLDSSDHSMRLISDYSPNEFNQLQPEQTDNNNNINNNHKLSRMFAFANSVDGDSVEPSAVDTRNQLERLIVRLINPISQDLMDFDPATGLQRTIMASDNTRHELQYRLITMNNLEEDDQNDFQVRRLFGLIKGSAFGKVFARLSKISDSLGNELELSRSHIGALVAVKSISLNREPLVQIMTNPEGLLTGFFPAIPSNIQAVELIYEPQTNLLREELTHFETRRVKKIVYDRIFFHFCDLYHH